VHQSAQALWIRRTTAEVFTKGNILVGNTFVWPPYEIGQAIIFALWFLLSILYLLFFLT